MSSEQSSKAGIFTTGFAIFSMFFGAGNIIFPLALGFVAKDMNVYASLGLAITAIGVPFLGLLAMTLFDGDYHSFFQRLGKTPGLIITISIIALIGPFGGMPRTITVAYATITPYLPTISLWVFSAFACLLVFFMAFAKNRLLDILGNFLTPFLLICLGLIITIGLILAPTPTSTDIQPISAFFLGLEQGYNTMDLLASFFFSAVVLEVLEQGLAPDDKKNHSIMMMRTLKAGCLGLSLLAVVYGGFSFVSAGYSEMLRNVPVEQALTKTAIVIMGQKAALIACVAVALACLTTAIALAVVASEYLRSEILDDKINYTASLFIIMLTCFFVSTLDFQGIATIVTPILIIAYPALIVLSICNILYKLKGTKMVKIPFYLTLSLSSMHYLYTVAA